MSPIEIRNPVWNGGKRYVSVRKDRLSDEHNFIEITAKDKNKRRIYDNYFYVPKAMLKDCETKKYNWGEAYILYINDLDSVRFWGTVAWDGKYEGEKSFCRSTLEYLVSGCEDYLDRWNEREPYVACASMEAGEHSVNLTDYVKEQLTRKAA